MKKEKVTSLEYLMPVFRERLATGQSIRFSPQGTSMLPMLRQGRDSVVISPVMGKLKKYDIPLYQRDNGQYVLHRIIEVGDTYICIGDNQFVPEPGLRHEQIIAVVTSFDRGGKIHQTDEVCYQLYCWLWDHSRHIRHFWRRSKRYIRRKLQKLI